MLAEHRVALSTVVFSGRRFVAPAELGLPRPVPLMVHGNSRLFLSLTHEVAEQLAGGPVALRDAYGYSSRGRGTIDVPLLRLGGASFERIDGVPVFDFNDEPGAPVQGMLGTRFLTAARAVVDFANDALLLGVAASPDPDEGLLREGYRAARMTVADDHRVTIEVQFPILGRSLAMTPSTVADALTLHRPTFEGRVPMTSLARDRSPSGTTPEVLAGEMLEFEVAGLACREPARFEDLAEYGKVAPAELTSSGMLGFDWMQRHRAILDYANLRLYVRP